MLENDQLFRLTEFERDRDSIEALTLWFEYQSTFPEDVSIEEYKSLSEEKKELLFRCLKLPVDKRIHIINIDKQLK